MNASIGERSEKLVNTPQETLDQSFFLRRMALKADLGSIRPSQQGPSPVELAVARQCQVPLKEIARVCSLHAVNGKALSQSLIESGRLSANQFYWALAGRLRLKFAQEGSLKVASDKLLDHRPLCLDGLLMVPAVDANRRAVMAVSPVGAQADTLARLVLQKATHAVPLVVVTPNELRQLVVTAHSTVGMVEANRAHSAYSRAHGRQKSLMSFAPFILFTLAPIGGTVILIVSAVLKMCALALGSLRLAAAWQTRNRPPVKSAPPGDLWNLPIYTILVPLYDEDAVCPQLVRALSNLDYPKNRLQILFLTEQDDTRTRERLKAMAEPHMQVLTLPDGQPRTKPRALGVGLQMARGAFITVFDAEDRPDPDQLKKAVARFRTETPDLACLQASLFIDHAQSGWLVRQFALEYASLFDVMLPWLANKNLLIPLGGTSNHFKTDLLRQVGGWDPYNVTEDADLGVRLTRYGYRVATLDSTTREEAPLKWDVWISQRRRWHKGWMQTVLVHLRHPVKLRRELGPRNSLLFLLWFVGGLACMMAAPWTLVAILGVMIHSATSGEGVPYWVPTMGVLGAFCFSIGFGGAVFCLREGARRRGLTVHFWEYLSVPVYWLLGSCACYGALIDLFFRPHHWRKTSHGHVTYDPEAVAVAAE